MRYPGFIVINAPQEGFSLMSRPSKSSLQEIKILNKFNMNGKTECSSGKCKKATSNEKSFHIPKPEREELLKSPKRGYLTADVSLATLMECSC